jgi:hypothetical protein
VLDEAYADFVTDEAAVHGDPLLALRLHKLT